MRHVLHRTYYSFGVLLKKDHLLVPGKVVPLLLVFILIFIIGLILPQTTNSLSLSLSVEMMFTKA